MADAPGSFSGNTGGGGPVMFSGFVQIGVNAAPLKKGLAEAEQATKESTQSQSALMAEINRKWMESQRSQVDARKKAVDEILSADAAMERSLKRLPGAAANTGNALDFTSGKASKFGRVFLEGSRGLEDFMIQLGPMGIAGGLRGAGNNISQMMSLISPMAGAFAGIGVAIAAGLINPISKALTETDKLADALERVEKAKERAKEAGEDVEEDLQARRFLAKDDPDTKDIRRRMDDLRIRQRGLDAQEQVIRDTLADLKKSAGLEGKTEAEILLAQERGMFGGKPSVEIQAFVEGRKLAQEAFDEIEKERGKTGRQQALLALGLPAAERREAEEGQKDVAKNIEARQKERLKEELDAIENEERGRKEVRDRNKRRATLERAARGEESFDEDPRITRGMKIEDELEKRLDDLREMEKAGDITGAERGTFEDRFRSAAEQQILGLTKEPKEKRDKAEITGIADLSKKIQLSLMPDKATKAAERTADEVKKANDTLKQIAASVKNPPNQFGLVAPGN